MGQLRDLPVTITWDNVVDADLLTDLLDAQVQSVCFELFRGHVRLNHGWKTHEAGGLVVGSITPTVTLPTSLHAIGSRFSCEDVSHECLPWSGEGELTSGRTATTLAGISIRRIGSIARVTITVAEPTTISERNVVGAGDALLSPRHDGSTFC